MSHPLESDQWSGHRSNKETENNLFSEDENNEEFNFKVDEALIFVHKDNQPDGVLAWESMFEYINYVPASRFKRIVKNVRMQRNRTEADRKWGSFMKRPESPEGYNNVPNNFSPECTIRSKKFLRENVDNVDSELRRLEEDAMPETNKIYKSIDRTDERASQSRARNAKKAWTDGADTGSMNISLAIPEEQHCHFARRKSSVPRRECVNDIRKASSDYAMRGKCRLGELVHAMDNSEYNSSPESSLARVGEEGPKEFLARPDPMTVEKVLTIQKKMFSTLDEIASRLDRIPLPNGDSDLSRRTRRVAEFSVRFSRYYLYDLGRRITDMKRHILAMSPNARPKPSGRSSVFHLHAICRKMVAAHRILLQALSAYCNHIPSSTVKGHRHKLHQVLQVLTDLRDICNEINISAEYYESGDADTRPLTEELRRKCRSILSKLQLEAVVSENESHSMSHATQSTTVRAAIPSSTTLSKRREKQKRLSARLSMYAMGESIPKSHPAGRLRKSFLKPRQFTKKDSKFSSQTRSMPRKQPNSSFATVESLANEIAGNCPERIAPPQREDDIRTMMGISPPTDSDPGSSVEAEPTNRYLCTNLPAAKSGASRQFSTSHRMAFIESRNSKHMKKVVDDQKPGGKVAMINEEHLSPLVPVIADLMSAIANKKNDFRIRPVSSSSMETLLEFLQEYQPLHDKTTKPNRLKAVKTGLRNMQLIRLPYGQNDDTESNRGQLLYEMEPEISSPVPDTLPEKVTQRAAARKGKAHGAIRLVPPLATDSIIPEYQHRYQHLIQANPMYLSNTNNKPWDVVARIADKLVDELIAGISRELEMENIIKKMFDLEFEEY